MKFGPEMKEEASYTDEDYHNGLRWIQQFEEDQYKSPVIDHAKSLLAGKVPEKILVEHPYETISLLRDISIMRTGYLLNCFGDLTSDRESFANNEDSIVYILAVSGRAAVESRKLELIVKRIIDLAKKNNDTAMLQHLYTAMQAVHTYALTNGMVKEVIAKYRKAK